MCGITGVYAFSEQGKKYLPYTGDAVSAMRLRGPDANGIFNHKNIALGHARLSIIDTSNNASQPFSDADDRYTIVFNGEFFNFAEHRKILIDKGYRFVSQSDTEVLLYLYIEHGKSFVQKINGFFAFAIYDKLEQTIFIARDRFGIKPLYYYYDGQTLIFASEMKALLAYGIPREIDNVALFTYLQLNYIPAPKSIFDNVHKLEPGSSMLVTEKNFSIEPYYTIPFEPHPNAINYDDACKQLRTLLDDAVQLRLISDVPLGAFLSGGIDSSVIVALASKHTNKLNTFSIGFKDEPLFDETYYANLVSKKFNTNHTVFSLSNADLFEHLYNVLDYTDEPFADSSALAVYILSKHTRKHVTVALSGDGADELFAGYNKHYAEYKFLKNPKMMKAISATEPLLRMLPRSRHLSLFNKFRQWHRFASAAGLSAKERYWSWCRYANENDVSQLLCTKHNSNQYQKYKDSLLEAVPKKNHNINHILLNDTKLILPGDMLTKVDLMSMANSLEVRVPFLDYRVVAFAFGLPQSFKIDDRGRKNILRDAFKNELPAELHNRKKHGFEVPLLSWFNKELKSLINDDLLADNFIESQGIFCVQEVRNLKKKVFSSNPHDAVARVWGLIVFQYWWKKHML